LPEGPLFKTRLCLAPHLLCSINSPQIERTRTVVSGHLYTALRRTAGGRLVSIDLEFSPRNILPGTLEIGSS
jgi:hypothetical protein